MQPGKELPAAKTAQRVLLLQPRTVAGVTALTYDLALTAVLWVVVAAIAVANRGTLSRRSHNDHQAETKADSNGI